MAIDRFRDLGVYGDLVAYAQAQAPLKPDSSPNRA
jgi:hypothetical protein